MKTKKPMIILQVFAVIIATVTTGCNLQGIKLNDDTRSAKQNEVEAPQNTPVTVKQNNSAENTRTAATVEEEVKNILPKEISIEEGKRFSLAGYGINNYDNSGNKIFSISDNEIQTEKGKTGSYMFKYRIGGNEYASNVTVYKTEVNELPKSEALKTAVNKKTLKTVSEPSNTQPKVKPYTVAETFWVHGITAPADGDIKKDGSYRSWVESDTTTWFNALKMAYSHGAATFTNTGWKSDASLCYGIVGSNLLHWWIRQNKDLLGKRNFDFEKFQYTKDGNGTTSKIADLVRNGKLNHGGSGGEVREVLYWFFDTYLKDVFTNKNEIISESSVTNKADFENFLNLAIENKEAVAIDYFIERDNGRHIVNVWGISKDSEGNIVEIWIGDSNLGKKDEVMRGSKLIPYGLYYDGRGYPYLVNTGTNGVTRNRVQGVVRLNLGADKL